MMTLVGTAVTAGAAAFGFWYRGHLEGRRLRPFRLVSLGNARALDRADAMIERITLQETHRPDAVWAAYKIDRAIQNEVRR